MSAFDASEGLARASDAAAELHRFDDDDETIVRLAAEETIELEDRRVRAAEDDAAALAEAQEVYADVVCDICAGHEFDPDDLVDVVAAARKTPEQFSADLETINAEVRLSAMSEIKNRATFAAAVRDRGSKHDRRSPILDLFKTALAGIND
jgi:hypothetical protein